MLPTCACGDLRLLHVLRVLRVMCVSVGLNHRTTLWGSC